MTHHWEGWPNEFDDLSITDERARRAALYDDLVAALEDIERGYPAGSPSSTLMTDGCWREFARELQRMARAVLSRAREKQP